MAQSQRTALDEYEAFKWCAVMEYNDFRDKANAEYVKFMRESWALYNGEKPIPKLPVDELLVPPVVMPEEDRGRIPETNPVPFDEIAPVPVPSPCPMPVAPIMEELTPVEEWIELDFYGTLCRLRFREMDKIFLTALWKMPWRICGKEWESCLTTCYMTVFICERIWICVTGLILNCQRSWQSESMDGEVLMKSSCLRHTF